jgi:hypothetical protein
MPRAELRQDLISTLGLRSMFLRERLLESDTDADESDLVGTRARAAANIKEWQSYLPADCVSAMLRLGWHLTT